MQETLAFRSNALHAVAIICGAGVYFFAATWHLKPDVGAYARRAISMQDDRRLHAHSDSDFEPETEAFPEDLEDNFDEEEEEVSVSLSSDDDDIDDEDEEHTTAVG